MDTVKERVLAPGKERLRNLAGKTLGHMHRYQPFIQYIKPTTERSLQEHYSFIILMSKYNLGYMSTEILIISRMTIYHIIHNHSSICDVTFFSTFVVWRKCDRNDYSR